MVAQRWGARAGVAITALVVTVAVAFWAAGSASAHVTVSADGATRGGSDQLITFRVPTESDTASTTGLKLQLPTDTPIASVLAQPVPGWTSKQTTTKLTTPIKTDDGEITEAVSEIDWTADSAAAGIGPGQFQEFVIIAGQLPDVASLTFKAIQTYSDGTEVDWIQTQAPGSSAALEHPAPVLDLARGTNDTTGSTKSSSKASDTTAVVLGAVGTGLGAIALILAVVLLARLRRRPPAA